jgi:hypothetical protein
MKEFYKRITVNSDVIQKRKKSERWLGWMLLCLMVLMGMSGFAQVANYTFAQSAGTYTPITGGTVRGSGAGLDDGIYGVTLPTVFSYNGNNISTVGFSPNGYLIMGTTASHGFTPINSAVASNGIIAGLGVDMVASGVSSELRWQQIANEIIFQWTDFKRYDFNPFANENFSLQIRLNTSTSVISVVYGTLPSIAASTTRVPQVGLRGTTNADYNARRLTTTVPDATPAWNDTAAATSNAHNVRFTSAAPAAFPAAGQTFTWTAPVAAVVPNCIALPTTPANGAINVVSKTFTWPAATGLPDGYRLFLGSDAAATNILNGFDVGAVVTYNAAAVTFVPNTQYFWRAVAYNAFGDAASCVTWSFTSVPVPNCATGHFPADLATDVVRNPTLSWTAPSAPSASSYDIYFGTAANPGLIGNIPGTSAPLTPALLANTTYYWKVVPKNASGDAVGCIERSFTTGTEVSYCVPTTTLGCTDGDVIARVQLNTLDNNTGTGCPSGLLGYSNYTTPELTTTLQAGSSYECTVSVGQYSEGVAAWIDYNNDGTFDNATERIGFSVGQILGSGTAGVLGSSATFPIVISCNPTPGNYRLRVRAMFNISGSAVTPCTANDYGETEDYTITISAAVACPQPNTLAASSITAQGATLNWAAGCVETLWDVHVGLQGSGAPSGSISDPAVVTPYVKTGLMASTQYEYFVRASCGEGTFSEWSGPFLFTTACPTGIWVGTTAEWNTASNWSDNIVPLACTEVTVNNANPMIIPGDVTIASLTLDATAVVTVNGTLNVGNIAVAQGGTMTVANDAAVLQTAVATNSGLVTVSRNSSPLFVQDYTLWSSPVSGQNLRAFSPATLFNRFRSYDATLGANGAFVQEIVTTADMNTKTFTNAKGYLIRMPNNWVTWTLGEPVPASFEATYTGTLNNGDLSIPLSTATAGFNLVGNPYPSPISINAFFLANSTNIAPDLLYFLRKQGTADPANTGSSYATRNGMGIVSADASIDGSNPDNIETGQGFFVVATTTTPLVFNNNMRDNLGTATFYRGATDTTTELHRMWLNLSNATNVVGQTLIGYKTGATQGVDSGIDALYFNDSDVALTSLIDNNEYIIQGRSVPFVTTDIVPLGFKTDVAGSYTISLSNFDGLFADNQDIFLKDNVSGTVHNLKVAPYTFTALVGVFNTRFEVQYTNVVLGTDNPLAGNNSILIGVKNQQININAGSVVMEKIELIDVAGRVIFTQEGVNATTATLENVVSANQMLVVRISTKENGVVTQKIIF